MRGHPPGSGHGKHATGPAEAAGRSSAAGPRLIRVLVADAAPVYRRGLISVLRGEHDISIVGEAGDSAHAVGLARALAPDLVLLDAALLSGPEDPWAEVRRLLPRLKICLLIAEQSAAPASVAEILRRISPPAQGYLAKQLAIEEVAPALRAVAAGRPVLSPVLASAFVPASSGTGGREGPPRTVGVGDLTSREIDVLRLIAEGLSNRGIAARLFISENTVRNHVRHILEKLQLRSRTEAALYGVRSGIVELDHPASART